MVEFCDSFWLILGALRLFLPAAAHGGRGDGHGHDDGSLLVQAQERVRGVQVEIRDFVKHLAEMNPEGPRWRGLEVDKEGLIEVAGVVCTK